MFGLENIPKANSIIEYQNNIDDFLNNKYTEKEQISMLINNICFKLKFISKYDTFIIVHSKIIDKKKLDFVSNIFKTNGYNISYYTNNINTITTIFIKWANIFHI